MTEHKLNPISLASLASIKDGTGHSIFGPSSAHMWMACSGSLIPNILAPDDAGFDAAYGTVGHSVTETWLKTQQRPSHLIGTTERVINGSNTFDIEIDAEMLGYAKQCYDRCMKRSGYRIVEKKVYFSQYTPIPRQGGTMDHAVLRMGHMDVDDHKFGNSPDNIVWAKENPQGLMYALGLFLEFDDLYGFKDIVIGINQPRLHHFDEWATTRRYLLEFADYVRERAYAAWDFDAPRTPGIKQCKFCKIRNNCAANLKMQDDLLNAVWPQDTPVDTQQIIAIKERIDSPDFAIKPIDPKGLTTTQMTKLLPFRATADRFWKSLEDELNRRAAHGEPVPGYKVVPRRTHRVFKDEKKALEFLLEKGVPRSKLMTESMCTPAEAERQLEAIELTEVEVKDAMEAIARKPYGAPTLAPLSDKRDAWVDPSDSVWSSNNPETQDSEEL